LGKVSINPPFPTVMGCGDFKGETIECRDELEANFLIGSGLTSKFILISLDLLYVGAELRLRIEESLKENFRPDQIFLCASHTHYAPMTDTAKSTFGITNEDYLDYLVRKILESIRLTQNELAYEVEVNHSRYQSKLVSNRRTKKFFGLGDHKLVFNKVVMQPNLKTRKSPDSDILVYRSKGQEVAVFWQYSCHPTSLPEGKSHSSHYIGEVRKKFRESIGTEIPFLFGQGFSGDLRPPADSTKYRKLKSRIRHLLIGSWFRLFSESEYFDWHTMIYREFSKAYDESSPLFKKIAMPPNVKVISNSIPISHFAIPTREYNQVVTLRKIDFGGVVLLGISAELVQDYQLHLQTLDLNIPIIGISCIDDVFGYAPTQAMMLEGV
jgi:hypothetical protein